ncbi:MULTISPECIES: DctP family TRAP transporter solute-binding subunit [unclassified Oscillibacter]|uniref:DctP family TRAP transporter solute-binding subunit n=1 Tax=unclassified Oscillibacter TaxID=2629304 RepID=UPI0025ECC0EB|nr:MULTISPECIES: DctP family TRAP transporter solute-binding subunit [unclassified Oscillibacter]
MKKNVLALLLALSMTASLAGCGLAATKTPAGSSGASTSTPATGESTEVGPYGSSAETQGKTNPIVVKVSNGAGETSPGVKAQLSVFAPMVENNSKGNIGVEVYSGAQLGDDTTATEMVVAGQLEINNTSTAPLVGYVPELGIFDIPFLFNDETEADKILASVVGEYLNAKLADKGIINLAWNENGFRELTNSKHAVASVADVAGLKIRTMENKFHQELWNSLGAAATPMSSSELYTALEQGTVDGEENPIPNFYSYQFQEVQKYITMSNHIYSPFLFDMSKKIWDTYDADTQAILTEAATAFGKEEKAINRQAAADNLQSCIDDYGIEVTYLTDEAKAEFVEKTAHIRDMVAQDTGSEIMDLLNPAKG